MSGDLTTVWIILAAALATYATRAGGYILIARFKTLPPRFEAALNAVPAAVLTTLVAPELASHGLPEALALAVAFLVALRFPFMAVFFAGWIALIAFRYGLS